MYPKLVGGLDAASTDRAARFYASVLDAEIVAMSSAEAAEFAKLAETTYRDVNIGLANQFARFAERSGIDVYQVIEASNSQPYSHIHRPGIAVGGHCIPVYPRLYLWNDPEATVVRAAREANAAMPAHSIALLEGAYGPLRGARVAVLGAAYRGGVKETAFSGVFPTVEALRSHGAVPLVHDPLYSDDELTALGFEPYHFGEPADAAVIQTDHPEYRSIGPRDIPGIAAMIDGRRVTSASDWTGVTYRVIGVA
jgi:nucleotide sugar dehydrogenase